MPATTILVEGDSDRRAVETLARRLGRDLAAEGVTVVSLGGATGVAAFLQQHPPGSRVAGLCDQAETPFFADALERAGWGRDLEASALADLGFFVCVADLEDELIRSVGVDGVMEVIGRDGGLDRFATFQGQPAWRGADLTDQLHRWMGIASGRKVRYAGLLTDAAELSRVPQPLQDLLDFV